jgi:ligand-binding sensor domain-containing protein
LVWGQQGEQIFKQDLAGAIHEGATVIANGLDTEEQRTIEGGAAGKFRVGVEVVFDTVAEKKFVSEHFLRAVKNWLAGNETLARQREEVRASGFLCGGCWFHVFYIGAAVAELQAQLWSGYLQGIALVSQTPWSADGTSLRG